MTPRASPVVRTLIGLAAVANLAAATAIVVRPALAIDRWPWELTRLSALFLAAMLAAIGAAAVRVAGSGDLSPLPGGFLNLTVTFAGIGLWLPVVEPDRSGSAGALLAVAVLNLLLFAATHRRQPPSDEEVALPPAIVRWSFAAFTAVLLAVGVALLVGGPDGVLPWHLGPGTAEVFGWIFVGDACYFAYALHRPSSDAGRAQLWSFLGYDLVLLPPLVLTLPTVPPDLRRNLIAYLTVLVYSALLGVWYLVASRAARSSAR